MANPVCLTVEEVNDRLPLVRSIVRDIVELHSDVETRRVRLHSIRHAIRHPATSASKAQSAYQDEVRQFRDELRRDETRLREFTNELRAIGGVLKDPAAGVVDFRSELDGDPVWLCWMSGDESVSAWHSGDCGDCERVSLCPEVEGIGR